MEYNIKLEKEISKLGFKKIWFQDKSGYWMEKSIKFKDLKIRFYVESDNKLFLMTVLTGETFNNKLTLRNYEDVAKFPCNLASIKKVINRYNEK
jgi:hypothetical protein